MWITRDGYAWHYLDRDRLILWTERSLDNFFFEGFGSWEEFLEDNQRKRSNPNDPFLSIFSINPILIRVPNDLPMDSVSFSFCALNGIADIDCVAKAEDFTFFLKEIVAEGKKETPKMAEEQKEMVARIGALIDKRLKEMGELEKE
jgi:hypothetical protein